jgi:hypothetical protein
MHKLFIGQRIKDVNPGMPREYAVHWLPNIWIEVDRANDLNIRIALGQLA